MTYQRKRPAGRPGADTTAYLQAFGRLAGRRTNNMPWPKSPQGRFRCDLLPDPEPYYREHLDNLRPSGNGWASAKCPFHEDHTPSLSVNLTHGGYRCHTGACAASGGGVLDFHMRRYGLDFKAAARSLGAWESQ